MLGDFIGGPRMDDRCARACASACVARQDRVTGDWSSFWRARDYLHRVKRVRASVFVGPRPERLQRQDEGVRRVVVPARRPQRAAQAVAAQRRPRRARAAPRLQARREPLVRPLAVRRPERDHGRAARAHPARGRHVPRRGRLAGARHAHRDAAARGRRRARPGALGTAAAARPDAVVRRPRARARHRRRPDHRPRRREPEPARLPHAARSPATCA